MANKFLLNVLSEIYWTGDIAYCGFEGP